MGQFDVVVAAGSLRSAAGDFDSAATPDEQARLLEVVDRVAEIPRAIRSGAPVHRTV